MRPLEKEEKVRKILERKFKIGLTKKRLLIGTRSDGSPIFHEFDIVSVNKNFEFDGKIVGEVKSDKFGSESAYRSTRFPRMITACLYLQKIKSKRKAFALTDREFYTRFKKDAEEIISRDVEIIFVPVDSNNNLLKSKIKENDSNKMGASKRKRNWLVEDNLVALYIALHKYKDLDYGLKEIAKIIPHKGFPMRIRNYIAIHTHGRYGLKAGLKSPLFREIYEIFKNFDQKHFAQLVNLILSAKSKINYTI